MLTSTALVMLMACALASALEGEIVWIGSSACLLHTHTAAAAALDLTDVNALVGLGFR